MARRRVLALGPAVSRMMCMTNPYQQIRRKNSGEPDDAAPPRRRPWLLWRRKKKEVMRRRRRTWGLRVGRLRIRALSPLALLKRLCDAYVNMMFSIEDKMGAAGIQCATGPTFSLFPMHSAGLMGTTFIG